MRQLKILIFTLLLFIVSGQIVQLSAQSIHIPESIVVSMVDDQLVSQYTIQPKNTLYSICKFYHCELKDIIKANPGIDLAVIEPGVTLTIPFSPEMVRYSGKSSGSPGSVAVYYKTSKKDNLFRISRIYFDQTIQNMMRLNKLSDHNLQPEQLLLVGWTAGPDDAMPEVHVIAPEKPEANPNTTTVPGNEDRAVFVKKLDNSKTFKSLRDTTVVKMKTQKVVQQNGLAIWNKESNASGIFALHNEARPGTTLEVINPLLNRKSHIKVIGKIPGNTYADNVKVILSPEAARSLGALDSRFYVRMNYITE
jgi:LysM repeat protein